MAATLTDKTQAVLRELFTRPGQERTARDLATVLGFAPTVTGALLGRLIAEGYVQDRRDNAGIRLFRLVPAKTAEAAEAAGLQDKATRRQVRKTTARREDHPTPAPVPAPATGVPARADLTGVVRVSDLRAAHARGEVSSFLLGVVEREVAKTVKNTTRR